MSSLLTLFAVLFGNDTIDSERRCFVFFISKQTKKRFPSSHVWAVWFNLPLNWFLTGSPPFPLMYMLFLMKKKYIYKKNPCFQSVRLNLLGSNKIHTRQDTPTRISNKKKMAFNNILSTEHWLTQPFPVFAACPCRLTASKGQHRFIGLISGAAWTLSDHATNSSSLPCYCAD